MSSTNSPEKTSPSILPSMPSTSILFDALRLVALGLGVEFLRRHLDTLAQHFFSFFFMDATLQSHDPCFSWVLLWITNQPSWRRSRYFSIGTLPAGVDNGASIMGVVTMHSTGRSSIFALPQASVLYRFWYGPYFLTFHLEEKKMEGISAQTLRLRVYTLSGQFVLSKILEEAETAYRKLELDTVNIYRPDTAAWSVGSWIRVSSKRTRPLDSVILDEGKAEWLAKDVKDFLENRNWYRQRGIPFHRGYLLHGPPGTGKTSLVAALAAELELDIYLLNLSSSGLDDATLTSLLSRVPSRAVLLVEDIDCTRQKFSSSRGTFGLHFGKSDVSDATQVKRVTLAGLLNALDGIDASEGQIVFATTNRRDALDPALCRPGRMDVHIKFDMASRTQAKTLFRRFYPESEYGLAAAARVVTQARNDSAEILVLEGGDSEKGKPIVGPLFDGGGLLGELNGNNSDAGSNATAVDNSPPHNIEALAHLFSKLVPERRCTMAMLQEYLMRFKNDPEMACSEGEIRHFVASLAEDDDASTTIEFREDERLLDREQGPEARSHCLRR